MIDKRSFSLLELLISFSIIILIISSLLAYLRNSTIAQHRLQQVEREVFGRAYLLQRLRPLFSHLDHEYREDFAMYTETIATNLCLSFYFQNKVDPVKPFSGTIKGSIYLQGKQIVLEMQSLPLNKDSIKRVEILLKDVEDLEFTFFSFQEKEPKKRRSSSWPREGKLPDAFSLTLTHRKQRHTFPIFIFHNFQGIPYTPYFKT